MGYANRSERGRKDTPREDPDVAESNDIAGFHGSPYAHLVPLYAGQACTFRRRWEEFIVNLLR
jgi:hypothetical protein